MHNKTSRMTALVLLALAVVMGITSCGGNAEPDPGVVAISLTKATADSKEGSQFVSVKASGNWSISIQTSDGAAWAEVNPSSGSGDKSNVVLSYSANSAEQSRSLTITLTAGKSNASATFTQEAKPEVVPEDDTKRYGADVTEIGWMELPKTSKDGRDFFTHSMTLGARKMRNYSYDWDYENLVSWWVAYPLNTSLRGSGGRSNAWGIDPNLPLSRQSNISMRGFNPSYTYARGHQLPSADRLPNESANAQTFYGTNMTPQMHTFNEGIWVNLESKMRQWGDACDTLYVVTGCVVAENSTKGEHGVVGGYALDNDNKKVAIPTAYYKAALRYQKNSTYGYSGYVGIAFYLEHEYKGAESISKSMAISIDELEEKIGLDLFVNLPAAIGEADALKVESQNPQNVGIWWK